MSPDADAVHARYVEALTRRMQAAPAAVQRVLQAKLDRAVAEAVAPPEAPPVRPEPVEGLSRTRHHRTTPLPPLGQLNQYIALATGTARETRRELRSAQGFRESWARIRAEEDVALALQRGPENAGPLNSHMLVLRTLGLLRGLSPDYLRRFMAHADTLLWLDQASDRLKLAGGKGKPGRPKK
ncbi:MAG: DUF2894 domain-containing protein [Hydrogenophaga sp.]|nr:DUF2894 domain-containing protein [Hydrogenophaga sp.]